MVTADSSSLKRPLEAVVDPDADEDAKRVKKPVQLEDLGQEKEKLSDSGKKNPLSSLFADAKSAVQSLRDNVVADSSSSSSTTAGGAVRSGHSSTSNSLLNMMNHGKAVKPGNSGIAPGSATGAANAGTGPLSYWEDFRNAARVATSSGTTGTSSTTTTTNMMNVKEQLGSTSFHPKALANFENDKPLPFQLIADGLTIIEEKIGSGKGSNKMKIVVLTNVFRTILYIMHGFGCES